MSFGFISEVVTRTGALRHLRSPWGGYPPGIHSACSAGGEYRELKWQEADPRPPCRRCVEKWRRYVAYQVEWATERLDELEAAENAREDAA